MLTRLRYWREKLAAYLAAPEGRKLRHRAGAFLLHGSGVTSIAAIPIILYNVEIPGQPQTPSQTEQLAYYALVAAGSVAIWLFGFDAHKFAPGTSRGGVLALSVSDRRQLAGVLQEKVGADELSSGLKFRSGRDIGDHLEDPSKWAERVVDAASAGGWLEPLIEVAQWLRPKEPKLTELRIFAGIGLVVPERGALDRVVKKSQDFQEIESFMLKLSVFESAVCRIACRLPDNTVAFGTGLLIGADLVLTNHHVIERIIDDQAALSRVECLFDFRMQQGVETRGIRCGLAAADAVALWSRAALFDEGSSTTQPTANELDFAVLRLDRRVGDQPVAGTTTQGASPRGWIELPGARPALAATDVILVLQHPSGETKKLTLGTAIDIKDTRIRHDANTRGGSSGSPCLTANLELCALHHAGDPDFSRLARFNQAIPIELIAAKVREARLI